MLLEHRVAVVDSGADDQADQWGPATTGGQHKGAVNYQKDGKVVFSVSGDATIDIAADLKSGTFTGPDFLTKEKVSGSYSC
jgi:predicted NUDIX family NTP pyrophosphohydrolase